MVFHHKNPNQRKGGHVMKKVLKKGKRGNKKERLVVYEEMLNLDDSWSRIELIQMLIPVGFQAIEEELQSEVMEVAGARMKIPKAIPSLEKIQLEDCLRPELGTV